MIVDNKLIYNFIAFYMHKNMIKISLHGVCDPSPDLSPRTVSALALRAEADKPTRAEIRAGIKNTR